MNIKKILRKIAKTIPAAKVQIDVVQMSKSELFKGKTAMIVGGGSGIGLSIAKKLAEEGAGVILVGRNKTKLEKAKKEIGSTCKTVACDISDTKNIDLLFHECKKIHDNIDILVQSAGISLHEGDYSRVTSESFDIQFNTNLKATFFLIQKYLDYKKEEKIKEASILVISSETADQCYDTPYGLTKVALNSFVRAVSCREYENGTRINAVAPGVTATEMTKEYADTKNGNYYRDCMSGRVFLPEEVAEVSCFILSNAAKCISGEVIHTNAGNHLNPYFKD